MEETYSGMADPQGRPTEGERERVEGGRGNVSERIREVNAPLRFPTILLSASFALPSTSAAV